MSINKVVGIIETECCKETLMAYLHTRVHLSTVYEFSSDGISRCTEGGGKRNYPMNSNAVSLAVMYLLFVAVILKMT